MFDIGGWELALIVVVAVFVIGPNELPATLRTLGRVVRRLRALSSDFRAHVDDLIREAELEDLRKAANAARHADFGRIVEDAVDPDHAMRDGLKPDAAKPAEPEAATGTAEAVKPEAAPEAPAAEPAPPKGEAPR